jgi:serine/threonine-protein kinase
MIGSQLGRYRVEEKLGAGGMGVVYRAYDSRLQRDVALKVLPERSVTDDATRKRFRREALALSRLNHPNIATVHDFDSDGSVDFLVMELIPGASPAPARSGLAEADVLKLGLQLAHGLAAAHSAGVLHRDLKPANLKVTPDGRLKILDFGLAQLQQPISTAADTETAPLENAAVGTLPYMAPEQVEGGQVDERSDVYGAGAVLYELLTGSRPFDAGSLRVVHSILHEDPPPPRSLNDAISTGAEQVVLKAMDKNPERRYQSAKELAVDLGRLIGSSESARAHTLPSPRRKGRGIMLALAAVAILAAVVISLKSPRMPQVFGGTRTEAIAILPLQNASGDEAQDYLVDGVTRGLINKLLRISALRVTNGSSVWQYKEKPKALEIIGSELGVGKVVRGSVTPEGERLRVELALVSVAGGERVWSETYTASRRELLATLADAAKDVAVAAGVRVTAQDEKLLNDKPVDPAAQEAHLRGVYAAMDGKGAEAKTYFESAIKADPTFAQPWAAMASQYVQTGWFAQTLPPMQAYPKAKEFALKAIALDETLAEPHVALAAIKLHHEWDWDGAEAEFKRAIELAPSSAGAHHIYAHHLLAMGRLDESVRETRTASELDPLNPQFASCVGWHCLFARQYDEAIAQCTKVVRDKRAVALTYYYLGRVYARQGKLDEAIAALQTAVEKSGGQNPMLATLGYALGRAGKRDEAMQVIEKLQERAETRYVSAMDLAVVYAGLNDREKVFEWLDRAFLERSTWLVHIAWDDRFADFHSDPRFFALLRRIGLPEAATPAAAGTKVARR